MNLAGLNSFHPLFCGKVIHSIPVFVTNKRRILHLYLARQFKEPFFFVLNPLNSIIGQKTELGLTIFVLILIGQTGNFALLQRATFHGNAHAAQILGDGFNHGRLTDTVLAGHKRSNGQVRFIANNIGKQCTLDQALGFINGNHILTPFRRRNTSNCLDRFSFLRHSFLPCCSTMVASICA